MKIASILQAKGDKVVTALPYASVATIAHRMRMDGIGAVVIAQDDKIHGILSERDILSGLVDHGGEVLDKRAIDLMSREWPTCTRDDNVKQVMTLMTNRRARHVPVVEDGKLIGLVSIGDLVKHRLEEMATEVGVLRDFAIAR